MFTANSMNCLCEALGIALPGNGTVPAVYSERIRLAKRAGMKVMELLRDNVRIKDILNAAAVRNAMECDMAFGGSTNTVLHLTAIANAAGCPIAIADWDAASARTPHLVKLAPSGPRPLIDLYRVGGVPAVMGSWGGLGLLDESALTCMGPLPEYLARCCPRPTARCAARARTPLFRPGRPQGALRQPGARRLGGEEGGGGSVHVMPHRAGPRVRFGRGGLRGHQRRRDRPGRWVVIRYEGRPEARACARCSPTSAICGMGLSTSVALITDGRFSGATKGAGRGPREPRGGAAAPSPSSARAIPSPWTSRAAR